MREGADYVNKRTLQLDSNQLNAPGILNIFASSPELGVPSVQFVWLTPQELLVPIDESSNIELLIEQAACNEEIAGQPLSPPQETYLQCDINGDVLTVPILESPFAISKPKSVFEFTFSGETPVIVRLRMDINGLNASDDVEIFLNGKSIGALAVDAPDLVQTGYRWILTDKTARLAHINYVGWRKDTILFPGVLLAQGKNHIQFRFLKPDVAHAAKNFALRNFILQLKFRPVQTVTNHEDSKKIKNTPVAQKEFEDVFTPFLVPDPESAIKNRIHTTPAKAGQINDINPESPFPALWQSGDISNVFPGHKICNFSRKNETYSGI